MFPKQENTRPISSFPVKAGEDLTGMDARLGILTDNNDVLEVELPSAITDEVNMMILEGAELGKMASVVPLAPLDQTRRFVLKGACSPGGALVMADVATPADRGKVRAVPAVAGTYLQVGVAMEAGVDGQWVHMIPFNVNKAIVVV